MVVSYAEFTMCNTQQGCSPQRETEAAIEKFETRVAVVT